MLQSAERQVVVSEQRTRPCLRGTKCKLQDGMSTSSRGQDGDSPTVQHDYASNKRLSQTGGNSNQRVLK